MSILKDHRCPACSRMLMKASVERGIVEIMCRCKKVVRLTFGYAERPRVMPDWNGMTASEPLNLKGLTLELDRIE